jgi:hypothetical protein
MIGRSSRKIPPNKGNDDEGRAKANSPNAKSLEKNKESNDSLIKIYMIENINSQGNSNKRLSNKEKTKNSNKSSKEKLLNRKRRITFSTEKYLMIKGKINKFIFLNNRIQSNNSS